MGHAARMSQLRSCNYYVHAGVHVNIIIMTKQHNNMKHNNNDLNYQNLMQ